MRTNVAARGFAVGLKTHEGGPAKPINPEQALQRAVLACFLWEDEFYESGVEIATRIGQLAHTVSPHFLADLAIKTREKHNLRHVPLLLCAHLADTGKGSALVSNTIERVVKRADELTELLSIYWKIQGRAPTSHAPRKISAQMKKGLAAAFRKFDAYQLAKYNREGAITLRDVMFLTCPKPANDYQAAIWKQLADKTLPPPDTWEVALSGGADKRETFTRLLVEEKLGYLALLRNLRNMVEAGVDRELVSRAIAARKGAHNVLPFRYLMAARVCPQFEAELDRAMQGAIMELPPFDGETILLVDVSGSMEAALSGKSQVRRMDAGAMLAALVRGNIRCFCFATDMAEVPHRLGMAGVDAFQNPGVGHGTNIGGAVRTAEELYPNADRIIVVTDEQSHDRVADPRASKAYMINVASYQNGVGYGRWTHIDGFSESTLRYIHEIEASEG